MESDILLLQIKELKTKMAALWDERGKTDQEILQVSVEIDVLLNQYYRNLGGNGLYRKVI